MKRTLVLGGPGAGKTQRLLGVMEEALAHGTHPSRIAFVAFTNAAADEVKARAQKKFGFAEDQMPYVRTIHSLCFRELGLRRFEVLQKSHLKELADLTGELATGDMVFDAPAQGIGADPLLTVDHYARTTMQSLDAAWHEHGRELDWFRLKRFVDAYKLFKTDHGVLDFTDMLQLYAEGGSPAPVEIAIVDEGQDLTPLQWAVIDRAFSGVSELWVGADDDQSVFHWAGASESYLLGLDGYAREVLPLSHRLPRSIFELSQEIVRRLERRYEKKQSSSSRQGEVNWINRPEEVDLTGGSWLLLARTRYQLRTLIETARDQGVIYKVHGESSVNLEHVRAIQAYEKLRAGREPVDGLDAVLVLHALARIAKGDILEDGLYGAKDLGFDTSKIWHDALVGIPLSDREYYLACLRRGEKLTAEPRVRVETIHGAKGAEAENVLLKTDLSYKTQKGFELDPDSEHRVFYVGVTRASQSLHLIAPQTQYGYKL